LAPRFLTMTSYLIPRSPLERLSPRLRHYGRDRCRAARSTRPGDASRPRSWPVPAGKGRVPPGPKARPARSVLRTDRARASRRAECRAPLRVPARPSRDALAGGPPRRARVDGTSRPTRHRRAHPPRRSARAVGRAGGVARGVAGGSGRALGCELARRALADRSTLPGGDPGRCGARVAPILAEPRARSAGRSSPRERPGAVGFARRPWRPRRSCSLRQASFSRGPAASLARGGPGVPPRLVVLQNRWEAGRGSGFFPFSVAELAALRERATSLRAVAGYAWSEVPWAGEPGTPGRPRS
jgi:hypothetical protein